jgi:hypothetical protein
MRRLVDTPRHARHHNYAGASELLSKKAGDLPAVRGRLSRTDDSNRRPVIDTTTHEKTKGRVGCGREQRGVVVVVRGHPPPARRRDAINHSLGFGGGELCRGVEKGSGRTAVGEADREGLAAGHFRHHSSNAAPSAGEHQAKPEEPFLGVIHRTHGTRAVPVILSAWIFGFWEALGATVPNAG